MTALIDTLQDGPVPGVAHCVLYCLCTQDGPVPGVAWLPGHLLLHLPAGLPAALAPAAQTAQGAGDRHRPEIVVIITYNCNVLIMMQINHNLS